MLIHEAAPFHAKYGKGSSHHNNAVHTTASPSLRETSMVSSRFESILGQNRRGAERSVLSVGAFCLVCVYFW